MTESWAPGATEYTSKNAAFRIETPNVVAQLHSGTNHQAGVVDRGGQVVSVFEFWQMNVYLEWRDLNPKTVTGVLGETMRPVLDAAGVPLMFGRGALRGQVEDYRISGPLATDFKFFHEQEADSFCAHQSFAYCVSVKLAKWLLRQGVSFLESLES